MKTRINRKFIKMASVSKSEYLKRYMSKGDLSKEDRKRKKRKAQSSSKHSKLKIIDDDFDLKHLKQQRGALDDEFNEDKPTVAEFIDERPKHVQQLEEYRKSSRWKILGDDEDETSALDYGVIPKRHAELEAPHYDKDTIPSRRRHDSSDSSFSPEKTKHETSKNNSNKNANKISKRHDSDSDDATVKKNRNAGRNQSMDYNSDNSPPRKKLHTSRDNRHSDSDASPPRKSHTKNQNDKSVSPKPQKLIKASSDSDNSPPRRQTKKHDLESSAPSPQRKNKHCSDSDNSPPRRQTKKKHDLESSAPSPQRKNKHCSDSDNSPPRRRTKRHDLESSAPSPQRKNKHSSDSDQSPPRKMPADFDDDQSPPRRRRHDSGSSDQSPPRRKHVKQGMSRSRSDLQDGKTSSGSGHSSRDDDQHGRKLKATKTLAGAKAGLSSAKEMCEEAKKLREKEEMSFQNIGDDRLGKNAKTVVRDKETGKRRDLEAEEAKNEEEAKKIEEQKEKYKQWGKGLKQQAMREAHLHDQVIEAFKPLARFRDDKDLDEMLRKEERIEDPMLAFIKKKKQKEDQKSGKKKQKEMPRYKGTAPPPNRYNIQPGYRWDGVDRSNGFEKKIFASIANKKAIQEMAYKWSTEDM